MGKYRGLDTDEGWIRRELAEIKRSIAELAAARRLGLTSEVRQNSVDGVALTNGFLEYGVVAVTPPVGYNVALVQMVATAGASYPDSTGANIGIQPRAGGINGTGQSNSRPSNAVGTPAVSVTAGGAFKFAVVGGVPFNLSVNAYATPTYTAGTANIRFSAVIIYTRE